MTLDFFVKLAGVLGFLLSIVSLWENRRDKQQRLKVMIYHEVVHNQPEFPSPPDDGAVILIYNPALVKVRVLSVDIKYDIKNLSRTKDIFLDNTPFKRAKENIPEWIEPRDIVRFGTEMEHFLNWLHCGDAEIRVIVTIASGKQFESKQLKFNKSSLYFSG